MGTEAVAAPVVEFKSKVAPELRPLVRPIDACQPHPDNARKHSLPRIAKSLNDHGQRSPIIVQASTGFIVKGNGTWTAAAQILGWTEIAQVWQDMGEEEALAYLLADNKASDEADYDNVKLTKALTKLVDGPGLMESLWSNEEFEDLVEVTQGPTILDPAQTGAAFADAATIDQRKERGAASGAKHKEVPLVMSVEEHAAFVERLAVLRKRWGITSGVAAVAEAVKRQADAEEGAEKLGRDLSEEQIREVRRALVVELRNLLLTDPRFGDTIAKTALLGMLESAEPQRVSPKRAEAEGQVEAFPEPEAHGHAHGVGLSADSAIAEFEAAADKLDKLRLRAGRVGVDDVVDRLFPEPVQAVEPADNLAEGSPEWEAQQAEALARFRASGR